MVSFLAAFWLGLLTPEWRATPPVDHRTIAVATAQPVAAAVLTLSLRSEALQDTAGQTPGVHATVKRPDMLLQLFDPWQVDYGRTLAGG